WLCTRRGRCHGADLMDRRWLTLCARGERPVPPANGASVFEGGQGELQRQGMRILGRADVLPVEDELAQVGVPAGCLWIQVRVGKPVWRRMGKGEEGRAVVLAIPGPPTELDLLSISRVTHDEVVRGGIGRLARVEGDGEIEGSPPCIDR